MNGWFLSVHLRIIFVVVNQKICRKLFFRTSDRTRIITQKRRSGTHKIIVVHTYTICENMQLTRTSSKWHDIEPSYEPAFGIKITYRKIVVISFWFLIITDFLRIFLDILLADTEGLTENNYRRKFAFFLNLFQTLVISSSNWGL